MSYVSLKKRATHNKDAKKIANSININKDFFTKLNYKVDIGTNNIRNFNSGVLFDIVNFGYVAIRNFEEPFINAEFFDGSGESALKIIDNEYFLSKHIWDIEFVGKTLTFREAIRNIFLSITIDSDNSEIIIRGKVSLTNGSFIKIRDDGIYLKDSLLISKNSVVNAECGLLITNQTTDIRGAIQGGSVQKNNLSGYFPIFICNANFCSSNFIHSCQYAIVYTTDYLDKLQCVNK